MKKQLIVSALCLLAAGGLAFGQSQTIAFNDNSGTANAGTYNPNDSFSFDVNLTFTGYTALGFSLWLETNSALAPYITITGEQYFVFPDATDNGFPKAFTDASGASSGFMTDTDTVINPKTGTLNSGDLGATGAVQGAATNLKIATISFTLAGAPAGTYTLQSTVNSPKGSELSDTSFVAHNFPAATYTITIVPEPATWSLMGLGGLGALGLTWLRARRTK
jgi:hypothetical protein